ncbi:MAG: hypothetical protein OEQ74_12035 [Gammaproteobacteria bacterium]|nr:hypothetical protein [Gammaproteobacteria bacterium]
MINESKKPLNGWCFLLGLAAIAFPVLGFAEAELPQHRYSLSLGTFITDRDTTTQLDSDTLGPGTPVDLENDLGLKRSETVLRVEGYARFAQRHRLDFSFFDLSRDTTRRLDRQIQFGDEVFDINTDIASDFDLKIIKAAYTYSLVDKPEGYLGIGGGLYVMDIKTSLSAIALGRAEAGDVTAPLPVIGLRGEYALARRWVARGSVELFSIEFDEVDGSLTDFYAAIEYLVSDNARIGLAYNDTSFDVKVNSSGYSGELDWKYDGILLYVGVGFGSMPGR